VLLGEVNLPAKDVRAFLGDEDGDELHMVIDFLGNQALYLALARGEAEPLARALREMPELPEEASLGRFVRNHDELTLDKLSGREIRRRLPTMLGGDQRAIRMVYSLAFSLPGTPVLFYGEEIGMGEDLSIEGRMAVRTPMEWPAAAVQRRDPESLLSWFERLVRRRRECPELGFGTLALLETGAPSVFAHRCDWDSATIVAVHELAGREAEIELPVTDGEALVDLFGDAEHPLPATLSLAPYAAHWFRVRRKGVPMPP
jgi:maltose alpha-D-glucosyltransferase/alpha-amylase